VSTDAFFDDSPSAPFRSPDGDGNPHAAGRAGGNGSGHAHAHGSGNGNGSGNGSGPDGGQSAPARRASDAAARAAAEQAADERPRDRTLALLLQAAERGMHVGLTVATIDGVLVTGTLVGAVEYDRAMADQFTTTHGGTDMDAEFADAFRSLVDDAYGLARGDRRATPDPDAFDQAVPFLHLVEARYVSGPTFLPHGRHGVLWRCRVRDVVSWSLGDLTRT
jgi:hypothetical protein